MFVLLALFGCGSDPTTDTMVVDTTCSFGPSVSIDTPEDGATFSFGEAISLSATASTQNEDAKYLQVLWVAAGESGDASGQEETATVGVSGSWTPSYTGTWRLRVQADDNCTTNPDYGLSPSQDEVQVTVQ